MGTVNVTHSGFLTYRDPKSGVSVHVYKNTKREGYDSNHWVFSVDFEPDDVYGTKKQAWTAMRAAVKKTHDEIKSMTYTQLWDYSRERYRDHISRDIARAMTEKIRPMNKSIVAKRIVRSKNPFT